MKVLAYKMGSFSLVNEKLSAALAAAMPGVEFRWLDVIDDFVMKRPDLRLLATGESMLRYPSLIGKGISPSALFPRCGTFLKAFPRWVEEQEDSFSPDVTFQTQSLFYASAGRVPHFGYTDHTFRVGYRYADAAKAPRYSKAWRTMEVELYRKSKITFTTSRFAESSIIEDYQIPAAQVSCVYSGINVPIPDEIPDRDLSKARILFVGVEWERKGGPDLLEAFRMVRIHLPHAELHVVGCRPPINEPGVFIHGKLPPQQVQQHFMDATLFCMPSRVEPSAVVLVEAAAYGLPVVTTNVGGNPDRVFNGKTGVLVPPQNIDALESVLLQLLFCPEGMRKLGECGREHALAHFTWPVVAEKIANIIN
jgi:glycosyltransferase involved in cell wall biosynthesis